MADAGAMIGDIWLRASKTAELAAFYRDGLGLDISGLPAGAVRLSFTGRNRGAGLCLMPAGASPEPGEAYGHVAFALPDIRTAFDRLTAAGAATQIAPTILAKGGPVCAFVTDPAGYVIELVETSGPRGVAGFDTGDIILGPRDGARRIAHTMLRITDIDAALRFYVEALGMTLRERIDIDARGGVTALFVGYDHGDAGRLIELSFYRAHKGPFAQGDGFAHIDLHLPDPALARSRVAALGFDVDGDMLRDADGHRFRIVAPQI